jgi:hypothetical protein
MADLQINAARAKTLCAPFPSKVSPHEGRSYPGRNGLNMHCDCP